MNIDKNTNVVIYLTGNKEMDNAIKKFCKDRKLNVVKEFSPNFEESDQYWNSAIFEMYFELSDINNNYEIKNIITYDLNNLFWCTYDQVAISLMFFDIGVDVFTLKEGNINREEVMNIYLNINEKDLQPLKKYWLKDKEKVENEKK